MILSILLTGLFQSAPLPVSDEVLRSRGYGWVLARGAEGLRVYHEAGPLCWLDPEASTDTFARVVDRTDGAVGLSEADDDQATIYVFDHLPALPTACTAPPDDDRSAVSAIADTMQAYYPAFAERGVDWADRRGTALADRGPDPFRIAETMLDGLDDPHLELSAEIDGTDRALAVSEGPTLDAVQARPGQRPERAWLAIWREGVETTILRGQGHVTANNRIFWGLRDGVGYLAIVTMGAFDPDDDEAVEPLDLALDAAMAAFVGARAVVVDVSNNRGGYDAVSRHIASRFTDRPRTAYGKRGWGSGVAYQTIEVRPSDRLRYLGPVWLLTSDITVSAGETFSQMMRVLPNVVHAGSTTRGAFSDQTPVTLFNGWRFAMPMETYVDPDGRALEGHGLKPSVSLDFYPAGDLDHGHARAVSALMTRLAR